MRGRKAPEDNPKTRERQVTASQKTANLGRKAHATGAVLGPRSRKGASGQVLFCCAPWRGLWERPWFRRSFLFALSGESAMPNAYLATAAIVMWLASTSTVSAQPKVPVPLTGNLIRNGMKLLKGLGPGTLLDSLRLVDLHARQDELRLRVRADLGMEPFAKARLDLEIQIGRDDDCLVALGDRLGKEQNEILRKQLEALRDTVESNKRRNLLLLEQLKTQQQSVQLQTRKFKHETDGVLRKESYSVPADKLVVVVADFSGGDREGQEIADEIAHHLNDLKNHGIDTHVLSGEVRPGVVIRSEEMACDVGGHFPPDTNYVVIWGTLSPRTVGWYRPHVTCVQKLGADRSIRVSFTPALSSQELPLRADNELDQRECYERLIAVTCAIIPSCFAMHELSRERTPNLKKFYDFIGQDAAEANELRTQLEPLSRWTEARKGRFEYLSRMDTMYGVIYPALVRNLKDDSLMVLITDEKRQPKRFPSAEAGKDDLVYIDVTETTNRQFVTFLNDKRKNEEEGGVPWLKMDPDFLDIKEVEGKSGRFQIWNSDEARLKHYTDAPVFDVSWFGATAYCKWAGKSLPRQVEWQLAARPPAEGKYPWGSSFDTQRSLLCRGASKGLPYSFTWRVGMAPEDRSAIGCFDMAGNVAEWCEDWHDTEKSKERVVCGGSYNDSDPKLFEFTATRGMAPVSRQRWLGFRGVVRVPVTKEN